VLDELSGGDAALAAAILGDSVESTTPDVTRLGEALEARDLDEVRRQAHRLKGGERGGGARRSPLGSRPKPATAMASVLGALSWRWRSQPSPRRLPPRRPRRGRRSPNRVQRLV